MQNNGLKLQVLKTHSPCLPETTAVCEEAVVSTEIQAYQLIKIVTMSTAGQLQDP